jgi:hypothetical protein
MADPQDPFGLVSDEAEINNELPSEEEFLKVELRKELEKTEEEINTLRQVLTAKEQHAAELRRHLGLTTLSQMKAEIAKIQSSQAYQKTQETLKSSGQATASFFSNIGSSVSTRFSEMKNSPTFKSFEERVEGVGTTIMSKVSGAPGKDGMPATEKTPSDGAPVTEQPNNVDNDMPL